MTYYYNESAIQGANEQKLVLEIWTTPDVNAIEWNTDSVSIHIIARTFQAKFSGDNQTFNRTGGWGGSTNFYMPGSANAWVNLADQWFSLTPQHSGPVTTNYGGNISGHYGIGTGFYANIAVTLAQKPYGASKPTLSKTTFDTGEAITIYTNRVNGTFTHTARYAFGMATGQIATGVTTSTPWTAQAMMVGPQIPAATQGTGTIFLDTYNGATFIGTESVGFTCKLQSSAIPGIGNTVVSEGVSNVNTVVGTYVKLLSKLKVQLTGCSGVYGSSVSKHEVTALGQTYDISDLSSAGANSLLYTFANAITSNGSIAVVGKVTDSRGRSATKTTTITTLDYSLPDPTTFTVQRCLSNGTLDPLGTYVKVVSAGTVASLINTTQRNHLQYKVEYRQLPSGSWTSLKALTTAGSLSLSVTETLGSGQFSAVNAYEYRLSINDKFNTVSVLTSIGTGEVTLSLNKTGVGVGKVWSKGSIDAAGRIFGSGFYPPVSTIPAATDLNTYTEQGAWVQPNTANANSGSNYPNNGSTQAGYLEVVTRDGQDTSFVMQRYTYYNNNCPTFVRSLYNNVWTSWSLYDNWKPINSFAQISKRDGFQALTNNATQYNISMDYASPLIMSGDCIDAVSTNGGSLRAKLAGVYFITGTVYVSGGDNGAWVQCSINKWVGSTPYNLTAMTLEKWTNYDSQTSASIIANLTTNQTVSLRAMRNGGSSTTSVWGPTSTPQYESPATMLQMMRIG